MSHATLLRLSSLNLLSLHQESLGRERAMGVCKGACPGRKRHGKGGGAPRRPTSGFSPGMVLTITTVRGTNPLLTRSGHA